MSELARLLRMAVRAWALTDDDHRMRVENRALRVDLQLAQERIEELELHASHERTRRARRGRHAGR